MDSHLILDIKRFEVLDQTKLAEPEALLDMKNINSKDLMLILSTLKFSEERPPSYTGQRLPKRIPFVRGKARIRIADRVMNLKGAI